MSWRSKQAWKRTQSFMLVRGLSSCTEFNEYLDLQLPTCRNNPFNHLGTKISRLNSSVGTKDHMHKRVASSHSNIDYLPHTSQACTCKNQVQAQVPTTGSISVHQHQQDQLQPPSQHRPIPPHVLLQVLGQMDTGIGCCAVAVLHALSDAIPAPIKIKVTPRKRRT